MEGGPTRSTVVFSDGFGISSRVLLSRNALLYFVIFVNWDHKAMGIFLPHSQRSRI